MKKIVTGLVLLFLFVLTACENDIELAGEYEEVPVVFGLLNANQDTQFVRISKTFLEEGVNAIELAKDPNSLYYDSLDVKLINSTDNQVYQLAKIQRKKEEGVFANEGNVVYYTDTPLIASNNYELKITTVDQEVASAQTNVINEVSVTNPQRDGSSWRPVVFKNNIGYNEVNFGFEIPQGVKSMEAKLLFIYYEGAVRHTVEIPIGSYTVNQLEDKVRILMRGERFYQAIADAVPPTSTRKTVPNENHLRIEVQAVDENYIFYREVNGPIENLSQVKPEYTNVENGIGLFASKSTSVALTNLDKDSRSELQNGPITGDRNFVYP